MLERVAGFRMDEVLSFKVSVDSFDRLGLAVDEMLRFWASVLLPVDVVVVVVVVSLRSEPLVLVSWWTSSLL